VTCRTPPTEPAQQVVAERADNGQTIPRYFDELAISLLAEPIPGEKSPCRQDIGTRTEGSLGYSAGISS
jgi:hypothetical protein